MKIIKRDGREVPFDYTKIKAAIEEKRQWFKAEYPEDYARDVSRDQPYFE